MFRHAEFDNVCQGVAERHGHVPPQDVFLL